MELLHKCSTGASSSDLITVFAMNLASFSSTSKSKSAKHSIVSKLASSLYKQAASSVTASANIYLLALSLNNRILVDLRYVG